MAQCPACAAVVGTRPFIIVYADIPIGCIQTYRLSDYPEHAERMDAGEGATGLDIFIGDPACIGRGIGPLILTSFVENIVFSDPAARS